MSAVKMSIDSVDRQCRSTLSAVSVGPYVAGLTEFSYSVYRPTLVYGVDGVVTGNYTVKGKKVKVWFLYSATYMVDHEQRALTISEVAVDWQDPVVLQRKCGHPLPALTDIGSSVAASKHTTAPLIE